MLYFKTVMETWYSLKDFIQDVLLLLDRNFFLYLLLSVISASVKYYLNLAQVFLFDSCVCHVKHYLKFCQTQAIWNLQLLVSTCIWLVISAEKVIIIWQDFKLFWLFIIILSFRVLVSDMLFIPKLSWLLLLFPYWHCLPSPVPCALTHILQFMKKIGWVLFQIVMW